MVVSRVLAATSRRVAAVFPERRLYLRSDAGMRTVTISPLAQLRLSAMAAALIGWTGYATASFVFDRVAAEGAKVTVAGVREAYNAKIATMTERERDLAARLAAAEKRSAALAERLGAKQAGLLALADRLSESEAAAAALRDRFASLLADLDLAEEEIAALRRERETLRIAAATANAAQADFAETLGGLGGAMGRVIEERDAAEAEARRLGSEVAALAEELTDWENRRARMITQLEDAARLSLSALEKVFQRSDLDLDRILAQASREFSGEGGLFEPLSDAAVAEVDEADQRIAALMQDLERVNLMRLAADRLPFGRPVNGARVTSGFGPRRDPFRRRFSMHRGIDFAGPRGTPIHATASGVVTFSGRQSGFGIVVKIRHAFGFETLYAHLSRSHVEVGQRVDRGDRIAAMGSTGRSTGSHLHYEVHIDEKAVNPSKFIEAARDVL